MSLVALRLGPVSRLVDRRPAPALAALALLLVLAFLASVALGSTWLPPGDVLAALAGAADATTTLIVTEFRLPRAILAAEVGAGLAVAGFLLQRATRNAFASPDLLGVVDGAGFGVVLFLGLFSDATHALTVSIAWQPAAALLGGGAALTLAFALAGRGASPLRLLLFGVAVAATMKAATMLGIVTGPIFRATQALQWLAGSVHAASWEKTGLTAAAVAPLLLLAALGARRLALLDLDPQSARGLGLGARGGLVLPVLLAAALTAAAVATVGGVGFVGLIAPHLARRLVGTGPGAGLLATTLIGALMVLGADLAVRALFAPVEVPTGAVTALVGAPYFLYLLARRSGAHG